VRGDIDEELHSPHPNPLPEEEGTVLDVIRYAGDRIKVAGDILDFVDFFLPDDTFPYDPVAFEKRITNDPNATLLLAEFRDVLAAQESFDHASLEGAMQQFLTDKGIKPAQIIHALRVVTTGKAIGLGMFETLEILGKERTLRRLERALVPSPTPRTPNLDD